MKKAAHISVIILEILCLAGAQVIQYFTHKKMGIARYVVHRSRGWEARYPTELLTNGAMLLMATSTAMFLLYFPRQRRNLTEIVWLMNTGMIALTSAYGGSTWVDSTDEVQARYLVSTVLGGVSLIQIIKTQIGILVCRHGQQGVGQDAG